MDIVDTINDLYNELADLSKRWKTEAKDEEARIVEIRKKSGSTRKTHVKELALAEQKELMSNELKEIIRNHSYLFHLKHYDAGTTIN